ncbi:retrotrans_gag domain-containing protein [Trichonephila clavipes]|nr:retrotrans_gag domain-containing protein [Trichonephila clavipes]
MLTSPSQEPPVKRIIRIRTVKRKWYPKRTKNADRCQERLPTELCNGLRQIHCLSNGGCPYDNINTRENPLKWLKARVQQSYIQSVLGLCQEVNPLMKEDEKVSHLMKGVAEDIYQALLTREINDTASFIKWCNYIEDMKQKRELVDRDLKGFQTFVPVASLTDETVGLSYSHNRTRSPSTS